MKLWKVIVNLDLLVLDVEWLLYCNVVVEKDWQIEFFLVTIECLTKSAGK